MITSMHIENFKCFKDFDIELGPFNVLIGPNDSGKTAFLQGVQMVWDMRSKTARPLSSVAGELGIMSTHELLWRNDPGNTISVHVEAAAPKKFLDDVSVWIETVEGSLRSTVRNPSGTSPATESDAQKWFHESIGRVVYYRWNPRALREPCTLRAQMLETGKGFPAFLDNINRTSRKLFLQMENVFYERFPHYEQLELPVVGQDTPERIGLRFRTRHGETLSAESVSDGVMMSLAFIAVAHAPDPPRILLVEEPENSVHHASLKEIIETLRQLTKEKGVQVILTTHSPYLLECVEPEEVHVFAKDEEGAVHTKKLSDHPEVEGMKKYFGTGEIWTEFEEKDIVAKGGDG